MWERFAALRNARPGGFDVIALMRPPDAAYDEDVGRWLERARAAQRGGPFGLHTHWTSPSHARPTDGDPAQRVHAEAEWMRAQGLDPRFFCGGGWYTNDAVRMEVRSLGLVDCTDREGAPAAGVLPTTHSLGQLARAQLRPLPGYVHAYFHDYDLLDPVRRSVLAASMRLLARRRRQIDPLAASAELAP